LTRVLVVDDDPAILRSLQRNLRARGYDVTASETGEDALHAAQDTQPDLVILDLMLPGISGADVTRELRKQTSAPILMLSARGEERAKVMALDLGADDYLTKPFGMDELMARIRALLRRQPELPPESPVLTVGLLKLDRSTRRTTLEGEPVDLTSREFDLLEFLMRHPGKVLTHRLILSEVWGPEYSAESQYLRVFINRLRRKIEVDPANPSRIVTDPGVGYRLLEGTPASA